MANASIGGLISGLDTASIISQLMQLEARPQTMLKARVSTEERAVTAMQTLNSKLASIVAKAAALVDPASWSPMKATSTNDRVTVSAAATATLTSLTFGITQTATSAHKNYATTGTLTDTVMGAGLTYQITYADGREAETINTDDGTLENIAAAINGKNGLSAALVKVGMSTDAEPQPIYQLQVSSRATGQLSGFEFTETNPDGTALASPTPFMGADPAAPMPTGQDAQIVVNGQTVTSSSNTIKDLMPGVDVTLADGAKDSATITIAKDAASLSSKVKTMVDTVNLALTELSTLTASGPDPKAAGLLAGDSTLRTVRNRLIESVTGGIGGQSLASYGIQTDRSGKLVFDAAKFEKAYTEDPTGTAAKFVAPKDPADPTAIVGFAAKLESLGKTFSDSIDGIVTLSVKSRQSAIKGMEADIADWDVRLATRQSSLQRQYTALETALGKLQSQGNWLAGQLASLPQMSSGQ